MTMKTKFLAVTLALLSALTGCMGDSDSPTATTSQATAGGGSSIPSGGGSATPANTLSGTAAVGAPVEGGSISVQCAGGAALATTTSASGAWLVEISGQLFPCVVSVTGGTIGTLTLHSLATASGRANVTPLTDLIVAGAVGGSPAQWLTDNGGNLATALAQAVAQLPAATASVTASLAASGFTLPAGDAFTASFQPATGDVYDDLLEAISGALATSGLTYQTLVTTVAAAGTGTLVIPVSDAMTNSQVAAMPQLNSATLAVNSDAVLEMRTFTRTNSAGRYVGGGTGNKAILQLPGLNGLKLADLKSLTLELRRGEGSASNAPYFNFVVDLQCETGPLPAGATIAQAQARRRIVVFNPYHAFYSASLPSTATFTVLEIDAAATNGWGSVGAGVGLMNQNNISGSSNAVLTDFDLQSYPNACIADGGSADNGLWRDTAHSGCNTGLALDGSVSAGCGLPHTGALLVIGDSGNQSVHTWLIKRVAVNSKTYRFKS
jgi:hypothetical protein